MKGEGVRAGDPVEELGFALAEGRAELLTDKVRALIVGRALAVRSPGRPSQSPEEISGLEAFRRAINQMDALLADLEERDWRRPALRDLSVQELIGHLVAAEEAFLNGLEGLGEAPDSSEHVSSTRVIAKAQSGRPPAASRADWRERTARTVAACAECSPELVANYYGIVLPLDLLLVVRSFEISGSITKTSVGQRGGRSRHPMTKSSPAWCSLLLRWCPSGWSGRSDRGRKPLSG